MAQLVKYLLYKHDGLNVIPRTHTEARCTCVCLSSQCWGNRKEDHGSSPAN